jgi:hypothetical protein
VKKKERKYLAGCAFAMYTTVNVLQMLCKSRKKCNGDSGNEKTCARGRNHYLETKQHEQLRPKKHETGKKRSPAMARHFIDIKINVRKEIVQAGRQAGRQAGVKICEEFAPNFGNKRNGCCITTMHFLTMDFDQNYMTIFFYPS